MTPVAVVVVAALAAASPWRPGAWTRTQSAPVHGRLFSKVPDPQKSYFGDEIPAWASPQALLAATDTPLAQLTPPERVRFERLAAFAEGSIKDAEPRVIASEVQEPPRSAVEDVPFPCSRGRLDDVTFADPANKAVARQLGKPRVARILRDADVEDGARPRKEDIGLTRETAPLVTVDGLGRVRELYESLETWASPDKDEGERVTEKNAHEHRVRHVLTLFNENGRVTGVVIFARATNTERPGTAITVEVWAPEWQQIAGFEWIRAVEGFAVHQDDGDFSVVGQRTTWSAP